jgi:DNA replication protein DnaC
MSVLLTASGDDERWCRRHQSAKVEQSIPWISGRPMTLWTCGTCEEELHRRRATEAARAAKVERHRRSGIPEKFHEADLRSLYRDIEAQRTVAEQLHAFANIWGKDVAGLFFYGVPGVGKTYAACALVNAWFDQRKTARYVRLLDMLRTIKNSWNTEARHAESRAIATFTEPHLLCVDDVGVQFGSDTERLLVYDVIDARYGRSYPTVVISNESREQVTACLGDRVMDRLRDGGREVIFDWSTLRRLDRKGRQ